MGEILLKIFYHFPICVLLQYEITLGFLKPGLDILPSFEPIKVESLIEQQTSIRRFSLDFDPATWLCLYAGQNQ